MMNGTRAGVQTAANRSENATVTTVPSPAASTKPTNGSTAERSSSKEFRRKDNRTKGHNNKKKSKERTDVKKKTKPSNETSSPSKSKGMDHTETLGESSASIINRLLHRNMPSHRRLLTISEDSHYAELSPVPVLASEEHLAATLKTMDSILAAPDVTATTAEDPSLGEVDDAINAANTAASQPEQKNASNVSRPTLKATPAPTGTRKSGRS